MKIGYVMSRFPKITETFILREITEVRRQGIPLELYPLIHQKESITHAEVREIMSEVHYTALLSFAVLLANLRYLFGHPGRYIAVMRELITGAFGNHVLLLKTLLLFPKSVCIARQMKKDGITHVHAHFATFPAATALTVKRLAGIPFSFTAHGSDIHVTQNGLPQKINASEFTVMISDYNRRFVLERCGRSLANKLVVIHCGIDPQEYEFRATRSKPPGEPLIILCVAALNPVKGHKYLIRACQLLKDQGDNFICHLIGEGPMKSQIEQQIEKSGMKDRFVLHGMLTMEEVKTELARADVFVLPSIVTPEGIKEGIPVALMEAMASGLPVVASNISGIPELVEDKTGILVPQRDSDAIAKAIQRIRQNPELRRKVGLNARKKVEREFNLQTNVNRLIELWHQSERIS